MRYKCFLLFIDFATTLPLNVVCGWFGLDLLQENKTLMACLVVSGVILIDIGGPTDA